MSAENSNPAQQSADAVRPDLLGDIIDFETGPTHVIPETIGTRELTRRVRERNQERQNR